LNRPITVTKAVKTENKKLSKMIKQVDVMKQKIADDKNEMAMKYDRVIESLHEDLAKSKSEKDKYKSRCKQL
jgi:hypothetical protein